LDDVLWEERLVDFDTVLIDIDLVNPSIIPSGILNDVASFAEAARARRAS
jgi:hypothetical protein